MEIQKFKDFNTKSNLKIIKTILSSNIAQKYLNNYVSELSIFQKMKIKNVDKTDREINLYFNNDEFIGFLVTKENHFNINKNKEIIGIGGNSVYSSIIIAYIEVRKSIRENKDNPRFGKLILDDFISENEKKYDAITVQAENDYLSNVYYPKYGFIDAKTKIGLNTMIRWS